jgi:hypothetical protein
MNRILSPAEKAAKQERRAIEGEANMARYLEQQQSTLDKTARLRALRLARALQETTKPASRASVTENTERRPLPGLHQGVRS